MTITLPAATIHATKDDATVEQLAFEYAFSITNSLAEAQRAITSGYVEVILGHNYGLADAGFVIAYGQKIDVPEFILTSGAKTQRLWGTV